MTSAIEKQASKISGAIDSVSNGADIPEAIRSRAKKVFRADTFERWLIGSEPFLQGRRPIDVIASGDIAAVLQALDAIDAGEYA